MTDERTYRTIRPGGGFDDDRLLALALGLDDDPELLAAAESDAELAERLATMRADVDRIGAQVRAAVPASEEQYTNLSGERWSGLMGYLQARAGDTKPPRARRWWRVVAPVTALVVFALVVGIVAVNQGGQLASDGSSAEVARSSSDAAQPGAAESLGAGAGTHVTTATEPVRTTVAQRLAEQVDRFAVVVLARARAATGALQRFVVVRIFKGDAPQVVELEVDAEPADEGRLHLLMLDPTPAPDESFEPPEPIPSLATTTGDARLGEPLAVSYTYGGEATMVREFASGTDPDSVYVPMP